MLLRLQKAFGVLVMSQWHLALMWACCVVATQGRKERPSHYGLLDSLLLAASLVTCSAA